MDRATVDVYEAHAGAWHAQRTPNHDRSWAFGRDLERRFATSLGDGDREPGRDRARGAPAIVDLGCGPGWYSADLGERTIALDAARAMLDLVPEHAPGARLVQADLARLPFRRHSLDAVFASKSYVHLARRDVPVALHDLHRALRVGGVAEIVVFGGDLEHANVPDDDFPGRSFSAWPEQLLADVLTGAGFDIVQLTRGDRPPPDVELTARVERARTLADTVGAEMRLLVCGLNPSLHAADAGVGFARPGNRFWPAALEAGIVTRDRDPLHALALDGVGMTDLVKRASPRADDLSVSDYRDGMARLERLITWLTPKAVCFVGLAGWRAAVDRRATAGVQPMTIGGRPVYVMPNTSGVNATSSLASLTDHLRAASALAG